MFAIKVLTVIWVAAAILMFCAWGFFDLLKTLANLGMRD